MKSSVKGQKSFVLHNLLETLPRKWVLLCLKRSHHHSFADCIKGVCNEVADRCNEAKLCVLCRIQLFICLVGFWPIIKSIETCTIKSCRSKAEKESTIETSKSLFSESEENCMSQVFELFFTRFNWLLIAYKPSVCIFKRVEKSEGHQRQADTDYVPNICFVLFIINVINYFSLLLPSILSSSECNQQPWIKT